MSELRENFQQSHASQVTDPVMTPAVILAERLIGRLDQDGGLTHRELALLLQELFLRDRVDEGG